MKCIKLLATILGFIILHFNVFSQDGRMNGRMKTISNFDYVSKSVDTLTLDTMVQNYKSGQRILKSKDNVELFKSSLYGGMGSICGCEAVPHGVVIMRYRNGNYKEIGEYFCTRKVGTWTYFYESGNIDKIETYELPYLEFFIYYDTLKNWLPLRNGPYAEYYENGNSKIEGRYEIVEEFNTVDTLYSFDFETYEEIATPITGSFWIPRAIKVGYWREWDENGKLIKKEDLGSVSYGDERYRPIASRYFELIHAEKK